LQPCRRVKVVKDFEKTLSKQPFELPENTFHEKENSQGIDGIFDLLTPEISGDNIFIFFICIYFDK
jgi:hypothetical protein